jgi:type II secretory pathway component GspD/PulD (secretin)
VVAVTARIAAAMMMLLLGLLSVPSAAPADPVSIDEMAFRDQPIADILLALAEATGTSIVPDHTVRGRASYRFQNTSLEAALRAFLPAHRLYTWQEGEVHFVSRVRVVASDTGTRVTVDANQVSARTVVELLAQRSGLSLEYGALPDTPISVHARKLPPEAVLRLALSRLPRYTLEQRPHGFAISRTHSRTDTRQQTARLRHGEGFRVSQEDSGLRVRVDRAPLGDVVSALLEDSKYNHVLLTEHQPTVQDFACEGLSRREALKLLVRAAGASLEVVEGTFFVAPQEPGSVFDPGTQRTAVSLAHITVEELRALFPSDLQARCSLVGQRDGRRALLFAPPAATAVVEGIVELADRPEIPASRRVQLRHSATQEVTDAIPQHLSSVEWIALPRQNALLAFATPRLLEAFAGFCGQFDHPSRLRTITLDHRDARSVLDHLPSSLDALALEASADRRTLYFTGTEEQLHTVREAIAAVDVAQTQLRYQLLMLEYQEGDERTWSHDISVSPADPEAGPALLGNLGRLMSIRFDVVSVFGYAFAASLNAGIGANRARVLADTVLRGLPGETVQFESTNTYRYRDSHIDPETGAPLATGVTREIVSGITVDVTGYPQGNGEIRVDVGAVVSKRGADLSGNSGNPPPTSEKELATSVRVRPGEPVALGELLTQNETVTGQRTPLLARIPLLGWLFKHRNRTSEQSRTALYLIVHPGVSRTRKVGSASPEARIRELADRVLGIAETREGGDG